MIKFAILGLLLEKPLHGYAVRAEFERRLGDFWELNYGQVYQVLLALEQAGLVSGTDQRVGRRPPRKVYALTARGRDALRAWLARSISRTRPYRDEFFVRLLLAGHFGAESVPRVIEAQLRRSWTHLRDLVSLREARRGGRGYEGTVGRLVVEAAILQAEADLKALELCRESLADLLAAPIAAPDGAADPAEPAPAARPARRRRREGGRE